MTKSIVNDFDSIAKNLTKLKKTSIESIEICEDCEDCGWVQVYSQHPPAFAECQTCCNPNVLPSP